MVIEKRSMVSELRSLDLNLLVALRALLDEKHVSRAADVAGLTQSGMSRALQRLRAMFNDPLLVKTGIGYELTARAYEIDRAIEKVLADIQRLMVPPTFDPLHAEGDFRIASLDYELLILMPSIISELRKRAPGIKVNAIHLDSLDFHLLIRGDVHLVFSAVDQAPSKLFRQRIFDEDKVCLVSARHKQIGSILTIDTFKQFDHLQVNTIGPDPTMIDSTLAEHGLSRNVTVILPSFLLAARIVAETDLIAILPRRIAQYFLQSGLLKIVELPFKFPRIPIYQYWHERTNQHPQQKWLRKVVVEVAGALL